MFSFQPRATLKVAHYGSGATGRHVLSALLESDDLELVAQLVHSPEKVGMDAGEIAGQQPVGVMATASFDAFLKSDADCVTYCASDIGRTLEELVDEWCAILATGKNIVTTTNARLVHPGVLPADLAERMTKACETGQASFFVTGIGPGLANDVLAALCSSVCRKVTSITASERLLSRTYPYGNGVFQALGFGLTPEEHAAVADATMMGEAFAGSLAIVAAAIGLEMDEIRASKDWAVAPHDIVAAGGTVGKGRIASIRFRVDGIAKGEPIIRFSRISSLSDVPIEDWEPQALPGIDTRRMTRIAIDAQPSVQCHFGLVGSGIPGEEASGHRVVNAIRAVCASSPGLKSPLDLPLFGGAVC